MKAKVIKIITLYFIVILSFCCNISKGQDIVTFGPMLHINFGNKEITASIALEASYWNIYSFPYSVNGGIEFDKKKIRIYSEFQTGIGVAGWSIGPLLEIGTKSFYLKSGFQTSLWVNYFIGVDIRYRRVGGIEYIAPGIYAKLPIYFYDKENPNGNNNSNSDFDDEIWDMIF